MLTKQQDGARIIFNNGYWRVAHDLDRGGAITELSFLKSAGKNFLARPLAVLNGRFSSLRLHHPRLTIRSTGNGYRFQIAGRLTAPDGKIGPGYVAEYCYTDAAIRIRQSLQGAVGAVNCWSAAFTDSCAWVEISRPMFGTKLSQQWHRVPRTGCFQTLADAPYSWGGFSDRGAGVQFMMMDVPDWWRTGSRFTAVARNAGVAMESRHHARGGEASWSLIMAPTSYGRGEAYKYREVVICSQPFPPDTELEQMKALGVNLVRIHEGANWKNTSEDFWIAGGYPPYPGPNLKEMKRVIATCHRLGIKIYPYFCLCEAHPLSQAFLRHGPEWYRKEGPKQYLRWSGPLTDQIWGAAMCSASGFGRWETNHIERIVTEYGFDGLYLDGTGTGLCYHGGHGAVPHTNTASHLQAIERLRRRLPGKFIVLHQVCSKTLGVAQLNLADHLVTFEELAQKPVTSPADLPITTKIASACISTAIVPGVFCPRDGTPLTPALFGFNYVPGKEPRPTRRHLQRGIPVFLLNGNVPYSYYFNEDILYAYRSYRDRRLDREGFYALFKKLKAVGDTSGRFLPWYSSPYRTSHAGVKAAAIVQPGRIVVIVANLTPRKIRRMYLSGPGINNRIDLALAPFEYRFLSVQGVRKRI